MTCKHYVDGGVCAVGMHGGTVSLGVCRVCEKYDGPSRGMGDTIHKVTRVTGIAAGAKVVSKAVGVPCGCAERRAKCNEAMPVAADRSQN